MTSRFPAVALLATTALLASACTQVVRPTPRPNETTSDYEGTMPNWQGRPIFGTLDLRTGFSPDPVTRTVAAGGTSRNPVEGEGCEGYLTLSAPDLDLNFTAGSLPLTISAASDSDISMVVYTADGRWICDDDSGEGLNPSITFENPRTGNYNIWIATYNRTDARPQSTVAFSELRRNATR